MQAYPLDLLGAQLLDKTLAQHVHMYVHEFGDQVISKTIKEFGVWEPFETKLLLACLAKQQNFVDVGANLGYYSLIAAKHFPSLSVFAFEPEPANYALLQQSIELNQLENVYSFNCALADSDGKGELFLSGDNFGDHQIYDRGESRQAISIDLRQGAALLSPYITMIDVLKIDTQGAEFSVIQGLLPILQHSPKIQLIIEFWPFGLKKQGTHADDLLDLLLALKRPVFIIDHIEHCLIPCTEGDLRPWIKSLDVDADNEGFMNLFFGEPPAQIPIARV
ncbi:MAG: FkbM family methyltransferase [Pseudomonadales bacterium]|nr:FkbM family methyltransferase [Pseudomonadales bacterium]